MPKQEREKSNLLQFNYSKKARAFFKKHEAIRNTFENNVDEYYLKGNTNGIDIKKMSGSSKWNRMRIDSYRIIYTVFKDRLIIVDVMLAGNRGEVYKQYNKR